MYTVAMVTMDSGQTFRGSHGYQNRDYCTKTTFDMYISIFIDTAQSMSRLHVT